MNKQRLEELREETAQYRAVADDRCMSTQYEDDLLALIDAELARQSVTDDAVQRAIAFYELNLQSREDDAIDDYVSARMRIVLTALRQMKPSEWIPVSERLPEEKDASANNKILVLFDNGFVDIWNYLLFVYHVTSNAEFDLAQITHWMPLPKPPESEEIMKRFTKLLRIEYEDKWVVEDAFEDESGLIRGKAIDCLAQYETANEGLGCEECFGVAGMEIPLSTGIKSVNFCPICGRRF